MAKGKQLTRENQLAPDIVTDQVETLGRLWAHVIELSAQRRRDLEDSLQHWNTYVEELEKLLELLNEKEALLHKNDESVNLWNEDKLDEKISEYQVWLNEVETLFRLLVNFFHLLQILFPTTLKK